MKRTFFIYLCLGLLPFGCFCPDNLENDYIQLKQFELDVFVNETDTMTSNTIAPNSEFKFRITFSEFDYVAAANNSSLNYTFTNKALAFKCVDNNPAELKPKIDSINITSNNYYNGVQPGINLQNFFSTQFLKVDDKEIMGDFEAYIDYINKPDYDTDAYIKMDTKPQDSLRHQFTVKLFFEDNTTLERETKTYFFQKKQ